ncbi:hypothetical protein MMC34_006789 [Xylographa carneopallida]|nr:hypothetical protein [Xylographa carneopallida]
MIKPQIDRMIYAILFPNPIQGRDPPTFQAHIAKNLVPEVRLETLCFYGPIDCLESQYPGLSYSDPGHRLRLSRFPYHRRLFRALDQLRLTETEIRHLCRWEGTKWARERYEKDEGVVIRDTTFDGLHTSGARIVPNYSVSMSLDADETEDDIMMRGGDFDEADDVDDDGNEEGDQEEVENDSEDGLASIGVELNQRLLAASEASTRGEDVELNPAWEQWLKEAAERGTLPEMLSLINSGPIRETTEWGQVIPEAFRYGPGATAPPHMSALQYRMPPPPLYPSISTTAAVDDPSVTAARIPH